MKTERINLVRDALISVNKAAYLAFRKDENNINNQRWEYNVQESLELIESLCAFDYDFVFGNSLTNRGLRNEVTENLLNNPNVMPFIMKEMIWALFEPFANNNFTGQKTVCIRITSYGEEVMKCTLLDVWDNVDYTIGFDEKVRGRAELEYLYYANTLALHMMEALQDIVEKGSFDAEIESAQTIDFVSETEKDCLLPQVSENLLSIFLNDKNILQKFLFAIKGKDGVTVTDEVDALARLKKIDESEKGDTLWNELHNMGCYTKTRQNWNSRLKKQGRSRTEIAKIQEKYQN